MKITLNQLRIAMPNASFSNCVKYLPHFNETFLEFEINTKMRIAHFLAQLAWESGSLKYTEEIASGKAYENRKDLGNTKEGDGMRFKGRGLIQITGRSNYRQYLEFALGRKLEESDKKDEVDYYKHLLSEPKDAVRSAGWFWKQHKLNPLADKDEFTKITRIINGSGITVQKRLPCLRSAKIAMGLKKDPNKQQKSSEQNANNKETQTGQKPQVDTSIHSSCTDSVLISSDISELVENYQIKTSSALVTGNPQYNCSSHL